MEFEERANYYKKFKDIAYYILVGVLSFIACVFLPFLGSILDGNFKFPNNPSGWLVWIFSKLAVAVLNILIFYCFISQAKVNIKDNKKFVEANEKLYEISKDKKLKARSPKKYFGGIWSSKGIIIFMTTFMSTWVFGEAILRFDLATFLSYIFTVVMGVVFGYLQMNATEDYWTSEYPIYVDTVVEEEKLRKENEDVHDQ